MIKQRPELQQAFLTNLCKEKGASTVFLTNGVKLQGVITAFDEHSLLLRREAHEQLVYKHAVSTIMPHSKIHVFDDNADDESGEETEISDQ